ncbi:hypothetical protein BBD42_29575 [Paenibacillus sp. BIHB 4019]|uniref:HTH lysR-type domain-containing protein n=1 Tax=Paenibacillus sp. BIHB 4019 TaxID=1870819 RepID=A0A1B2DR36_9BACL|nr:LysR family transcriptional regulator [Paenibacillus sp. BIHB 4019]ANY70193.1 hypothetical protein BBD42_29575 [Paenibacillus sp. BIHB 4019]
MTFQQLRYLVEVSKHSSISKAASALYMTQPSISKAIQDLEKELGVLILDRRNKGVTFTKEGTELLFYAKMLLEQMGSVVDHFNKKNTTELKKLSLSSQHYSFAIEAFSKWMNDFAGHKYELTMREGKTIDVIEDVHLGKSIIGILSLTPLNKHYFERYFLSKSLIFTPLTSIKQHVFLRNEHPLASFESIALEQLKPYPYLTYQKDDMLLHFAEEAINMNTLEKLVYINDRGTMNDILSNTNGYNIGTGSIVKNNLNPPLIAIPLENGHPIEIGYIRRNDIILPEEIKVYIELVSEALEKAKPKS